MAYVINVTAGEERLFSTSRGSAKTKEQAVALTALMREHFPQEDGFELTVFKLTSTAIELDLETLDPETFDPIK